MPLPIAKDARVYPAESNVTQYLRRTNRLSTTSKLFTSKRKGICMKIDLHVHTNYSPDSLCGFREIFAKAKEFGIIPAITDHGNIKSHAELRKMGFRFIAGEEMKTLQGDLIGLYLNELIPDKLDFLETLDQLKDQGAISYLPHMYDARRHGVSDEKLAKKVDVVEVLNGHCTKECNANALEFAERNRKLKGAGSDAHLLFEFGRCWIEMKEFDVENPKELLNALRNGKICGEARPTMLGVHGAVKVARKFFRI